MTDPKTPVSPPGGGEADRNQPGVNRPGETDEQRREREQREREAEKKAD
jgi:hypothetical protein